MKIPIILTFIALLSGLPSHSYAFRCGTSLITEGDVLYHVQKKCGDPDAEFAYSTPMSRGLPTLYAGENKVVIWTYDRKMGSGVVHRLRFQDGVLSRITTIRR